MEANPAVFAPLLTPLEESAKEDSSKPAEQAQSKA